MKKLLYILFSTPLLLYSFAPCMAQTPGHKVDSIYVYNEKDSLIFMQEWEYDGSYVVNEVQYTWDKEGVKHGDFNTFKAFDAKGNNVLYVTLEWSDVKQDWVGRGRFENVYNEDGKFSYHALWKEDQWKKDSIWLCQYNAQKQPILTLHQLFRNDQWQEQYKLIQDYDGSREIYHEEYSGRDANGLIGKSKWQQLYSGSTKISDRQYTWSGTEFVPKSWDTVGVVGGKTTLKESYVWTNGVQTGKSKEEWEFNGSGKQTLNIKYSGWENGAFVPSTKQVDEWSGSTNTMTAKYNWDKANKQWVGTTKTENLTSDGYTIKKTYSGWADNDFVPSTIDSTKNLNGKKVYYAKWTYSNGVWKGNSKEVYAYEGSNQTLQEKYSSWNNGWVGSNGNKWEQIWKNNKVWSKVTYNWSSGWVPNVKDSTEYNGSDITLSVHYKWTGSAWEGDNSKSNYSQTYISAGQKEWTTSLMWENNQWTNYIQTRSIYEGGKLKEERSQQWNSLTSAWQDVKVVYHTWENGVETFTRTEEWDSATGKLKMTKQYKHVIEKNLAGKKILDYEMSCGADSAWTGKNYYKNTWDFDDYGNEIGVARYTWRNNDWGVDWITSVQFLNGNSSKPLYKDRWKWDNSSNKLIGDYKYEYEYDENMRQIMNRSWTWRSGDWYGSAYSETSFNEQGLTDTVTNYSYYQKNWVGATRHAYTYYDDKSLHEDIKFDYNRDGKFWYYTTKDEYLYFRGSSAGNRSYEYLDGVWSPVSINEYHYDDDAVAKLREEIHGTWSKGIVVKYERRVYFYTDDPK